MKENKLIIIRNFLAISLFFAIGILSGVLMKTNVDRNVVGNISRLPTAYSKPSTYTSSTWSTPGARELVPNATTSRSYAKVCARNSVGLVWLFKQATSTGVVVNQGTAVFASTSTQYPTLPNCMIINGDDPYTQAIWGISNVSSTVDIEYNQE